MSVFIYWNKKDNDSKKMFYFMSPSHADSIQSVLNEIGDVKVESAYRFFEDSSKIFERIKACSLVVFMTHGEEDCILKFKVPLERNRDDFILVSKENANILSDKIVIALCCASAKELGCYCVDDSVGCKAFIGFERDIVYDDGTSVRAREIMFKAYRKAFGAALKDALLGNCTCATFQKRLQFELRKAHVDTVFGSDNFSMNSEFMSASAAAVILGDGSIRLLG